MGYLNGLYEDVESGAEGIEKREKHEGIFLLCFLEIAYVGSKMQ